MASGLYLEIIGADQLRRAARACADTEMKSALRKANKDAASVVARLALSTVPVGPTGRLRASIRATATQAKGNVRAGSASRVPYAEVVHWGRFRGNVGFKHGGFSKPGRSEQGKFTRRSVNGNPFLWNALQRGLDSGEIVKSYDESVNEILRLFEL